MLQFRAEGSGEKTCSVSVAMAISVAMAVKSDMCVMQCAFVPCDSAATPGQDSVDQDQELARSLQSVFDAQVVTTAATAGDEAFARSIQQQWFGATRLRGQRSTNDAATPISVVRVLATPASLPCSDTSTVPMDLDGSTAADGSHLPALIVLAQLADLTAGIAGTILPLFQTTSIQGGDSLNTDDTHIRTTETQTRRQRGSSEMVDVGSPVSLDGDLLPSRVEEGTNEIKLDRLPIKVWCSRWCIL